MILNSPPPIASLKRRKPTPQATPAHSWTNQMAVHLFGSLVCGEASRFQIWKRKRRKRSCKMSIQDFPNYCLYAGSPKFLVVAAIRLRRKKKNWWRLSSLKIRPSSKHYTRKCIPRASSYSTK